MRKEQDMDYEIIRTKRKTVAISVSREQKITIRTPLKLSAREAERIINENSDWIKKQLHIMKERSENSIYSRLSECDIQFLKEKAKKVLYHRVSHYSEIMQAEPKGIKITSAKTRWGSCSAKNSLCFSWRLMLLPDDIIDYIVVHELAHIRVKNHQKQFYDEVRRYMPDYRERELRLKKIQREL